MTTSLVPPATPPEKAATVNGAATAATQNKSNTSNNIKGNTSKEKSAEKVATPAPTAKSNAAKKEEKQANVSNKPVVNMPVKHVLKVPRGIQKWPNQVVEMNLKQGFNFNMMIIGEASSGKLTLFHSLFDIRTPLKPVEHQSGNFNIFDVKTTSSGSPINIRGVLTKNYNDKLDPDADIQKILDYIEETNKKYLQSETKFKLSNDESDQRIHLVLFLMTSMNSINKSQLKVLKALSHLNVVPVLAKCDTMIEKERLKFKEAFAKEVASEGIKLFKFPENMAYAEENKITNHHSPFGVLGSMDFIDDPKGQVRARSYSYAVIEIENPKHSEFSILRDAIVNRNLVNLVKMTDQGPYADFKVNAFKSIKLTEDSKESPIDLIVKHVNSLRVANEQETQNMKQSYEEISIVESNKFQDNERELNSEYRRKADELNERIEELKEAINSYATGSLKSKKK